jgi:hypothetical protein
VKMQHNGLRMSKRCSEDFYMKISWWWHYEEDKNINGADEYHFFSEIPLKFVCSMKTKTLLWCKWVMHIISRKLYILLTSSKIHCCRGICQIEMRMRVMMIENQTVEKGVRCNLILNWLL